MKKRISVSQSPCISCSTCWILDPNHFAQGNDGKALVRDGQDDSDLQSMKIVTDDTGVADATASCPVGAITVEDVE